MYIKATIMDHTLLLACLLNFVFVTGSAQTPPASQLTPPRIGDAAILKGENPLQVYVCRGDVEVLVSKNQRQKGVVPLWSNHVVYKELADYYFLGQPSQEDFRLEKRIGWVHKQYVLDRLESLRTPNKIYRRVIVFNNRHESRVPVLSAPVNNADELNKTPMFTFFYIYAETEEYYLIGTTTNINIEEPGREILGWINKKNCHEWNTRLSVNYSTDTKKLRLNKEQEQQNGLVRIYQTDEAALAQTAASVISQETAEATWQYNMVCYPLLQSKTVKQKRLFEVAFLTGSKSDNTQEMIAKIKEQKAKLSRLDIVLLVDAASSRPMRERIGMAIEKTMKRLKIQKAKTKLDIAWGLAFYHDFEKGKNYPYRRGRLFQPKVIHLHDFFSEADLLIRAMENEPYLGNRYDPRSLYYGLDMVAQNVKWRDGSTRCVINIGITGNHETDNPQNISKLTMAEIKEVLQQNSIRLFGAQFEEDNQRSPTPEIQSFARQTSEICKALGDGGFFLLSSAENDHRPKKFYLENFLEILLDLYKQEIPLLDEAINDLSLGFQPDEVVTRHEPKWNKVWNQYRRIVQLSSIYPEVTSNIAPVFFTPQLKNVFQNFFQRHQIQFVELRSQTAFYTKGWVSEFQPATNVQQIQVRLLIDKIELSRLIGFLSSLSMELKSASKPEQYVQIWKTLLQTMFGIDTIPPDEPLDNLIVQHSGLPFMNGLLQYTLDDFVSKARNNEFRNDIVRKLDTTCDRLLMVAEEKEMERVMASDGMSMLRKKKRWWDEGEISTSYAWLEVEMFP